MAKRGVLSAGRRRFLMPRFDVHKDGKGALYPLLLDVQADLLSHVDTRVVSPRAKTTIPGQADADRQPVRVIAAHRTEVVTALDFPFTGR